jgi:hypothetical protein
MEMALVTVMHNDKLPQEQPKKKTSGNTLPHLRNSEKILLQSLPGR